MRKALHILGQLNDLDVDWLANVGTRQDIPPGLVLIASGTFIKHLYIVLDGELMVLAHDGREISRVAVGDILGELSFVDGGPASATVKSATDAKILAIDRALVSTRLEKDHAFASRFYRAIATFLASRMRSNQARFGFGQGGDNESAMQPDELDEGVLDNLHLAGGRFERILKKLVG